MPITPSETTTDSYAPFAWNLSVTVLALEKLLRRIPIKDIKNAELKSLASVNQKLHLLSEASQIPVNDLFQGNATSSTSRLSEGFSTLVAIEEKSLPQDLPSFKQGSEDLSAIQVQIENQETEKLDPGQIERAQEVCLEILEHLNKQ